MALKQSSVNCKLKTRVAFLSLLLICVSIALLYRALVAEYPGSNSDSLELFPTLGKKRPVRFHSKFIPDVPIDFSPLKQLDSEDFAKDLPLGLGDSFSSGKDRDLLNADSKEALSTFLSKLYPSNWATAPETDEVALELKYLLLDYGFESKMTCKEIDSLHIGHAITLSRTKYIEYGYIDNEDSDYSSSNSLDTMYYNGGYQPRRNQRRRERPKDTAIKSPSNDLDTKIECMKQIYDAELCSTMGNYR